MMSKFDTQMADLRAKYLGKTVTVTTKPAWEGKIVDVQDSVGSGDRWLIVKGPKNKQAVHEYEVGEVK